MGFTVIIPARFASTRFPGKPLAEIRGKPMIEHVVERAKAADAQRVIVATDDNRIEDTCRSFGAEVVMTDPDHANGTSRIAQVIEQCQIPDNQIIINVQGDEPFIPAQNIKQLASMLNVNTQLPMSTLCHAIEDATDVFNPNVVKVVIDRQGNALYFSRSPIPYPRDYIKNGKLTVALKDLPFQYFRHIGIYGYRAGFVLKYKTLESTPLSVNESLEQLRVLEYGYKIGVQPASVAPPHGVDTPEDLIKLLNEVPID